MKQGRRGSKKHGSGLAALWLLLPLLVLIVLKTNLLPQVARCKSPLQIKDGEETSVLDQFLLNLLLVS
jgi:hypothetical protein